MVYHTKGSTKKTLVDMSHCCGKSDEAVRPVFSVDVCDEMKMIHEDEIRLLLVLL